MEQTLNYINNNKEKFLNELFDLLRIPSISADPAYAGDVNRTAEVIADQFKGIGLDNVEICQTAGYPIVYADKIIDPLNA